MENKENITKELLEHLYTEEEMSIREIGKKLGITRGQVETLMETYNVQPRTYSEAMKVKVKKYREEKHLEAIETLNEKLSNKKDLDKNIRPVPRKNLLIPIPLTNSRDATLTVVISDLHIGDANHLPETYWSTISNICEVIKNIKSFYNIKNLFLVLNGDIVAGRDVYKSQELRNIIQRGHWQVFLAEMIVKDTIDKLSEIKNIDKIIFVRGTHECYDQETEILTKEGFKNYNNISIGEEVMTYNKELHTYEWNPILKLYKNEHYDGNLMEIDYGFGKQVITPNHRCIFEDRISSNYKKKKIIKELLAKDLKRTLWRKNGEIKNLEKWGLLNGVGWNGYYSGFSTDELKLIAWLISEGSRDRRQYGWRYCIIQKNPKYISELKILFNNLHLNPECYVSKDNCHRWRFRKENNLKITQLLGDNWKLIPRQILDAPKEELDLFYYELAKGDGTQKKGNIWIYYTNNIKLRDQIQEILLKLGRNTSFYKRTNNKFGKYDCKDDFIIYNRKKSGSIKSIKMIDYKGIVWCPTVNNGYVLMRRGRTPFISGNSLANNFVLYLKRLMNYETLYLSHGGVFNISGPLGEYNILFSHGYGWSDASPVSSPMMRDVLKVLNTYRSTGINIERICSSHSHWISSGFIFENIYFDTTGGFQKWEYTLSQRPAGAIIYLFNNGECVSIPVRPDPVIEANEKSDVGLEYKNLIYYGTYLLKHLKEIEKIEES